MSDTMYEPAAEESFDDGGETLDNLADAPVELQVALEDLVSQALEQRLDEMREQQQHAAQYQESIEQWLGEPWSDGYDERLAQLEHDARMQSIEQRLLERFAPIEQFVEQQRVATQEAHNEQAIAGAVDGVLAGLGAELGDVDRAAVIQRSEQSLEETIQLAARTHGHSREQALEVIKEMGGFPLVVSMAARDIAAGTKASEPPRDEREAAMRSMAMRNARTEVEVARFATVELGRDERGRFTPRPAPSALHAEAARFPSLQNELDRHEQNPRSEADAARRFMNNRRAAA